MSAPERPGRACGESRESAGFDSQPGRLQGTLHESAMYAARDGRFWSLFFGLGNDREWRMIENREFKLSYFRLKIRAERMGEHTVHGMQ